MINTDNRWDCTSCRFYFFAEEGIELAEDSEKAGRKIEECIDGLERLKAAVDEVNKGLDRRDKGFYTRQLFTTDKPIGKVIASNVSDSVGRMMAEGLGFHKPERVIGKIEDMRYDTDGINCKCLCIPSGAPQHSGRYPWGDIRNGKSREEIYDSVRNKKGLPSPGITKIIDAYEDLIISEFSREYDNIMIRKVLNMDSIRFNRFISMLDAAGGHFQIDSQVGTESMATIQIPTSMLYHLHIDGDGSTPRETNPKIPSIRNIQTFNDRAIQITFADGSQTKCVCGKDEFFDLYEGIAFCLFKRFLGREDGHKTFNNLMRYAFKKLDEQEEAKKREAEIEAENKRHEEKKKLHAQRRKEKKREEKIDIFVEALQRNMQKLTNCMPVYSVPEPAFKPDENPEKEG